MAFSVDEQEQINREIFSVENSEHMALLGRTLDAFKAEYNGAKLQTYQIAAGIFAALTSSIISCFPFTPNSGILIYGAGFYSCWYFKDRVSGARAYQSAFSDMLQVYDWMFKGEVLPDIRNPKVQSVILDVAKLVNPERLKRLEGYQHANRQSNSASASSVLSSLGSYALSTGLGFFGYRGEQTQQTSENVLSRAAMELVMRDLLKGFYLSTLEYAFLGEGSQIDITGYFRNNWNRVNAAVSQAGAFLPSFGGGHGHSD